MRGSKYAIVHKTYLVVCRHDCRDFSYFNIINDQYLKIE